MNIHPLEPERFHELPIEANPATSIVIVAEDDDHNIKGYWFASLVVHTEPVWLSPELRGGKDMVGIKMYAALLAALNQFGISSFYAFADREDIADYLQRLGLKLTPFICYQGQVPEINECPPLQQSSQPSSEPVEPSAAAS